MKHWWDGYPWRMIQTNLRETDMLDIDAEQYVKDLQAFDATIVKINVAGIIASYPTKLDYHHQSPYLKGDSLETIISACHEAGIKVIARCDFSKVRREIYERHPEWAYVSPKGEIIDYYGNVTACICGDYQQKLVPEIIKEAVTSLDFDGMFFNMAGFVSTDYAHNNYGICQCASCRRMFRERYGLNLPKAADRDAPAYAKYLLFKQEIVAEYNRRLYDLIHGLKPDMLISNDTVSYETGYYRQESNTALDRALPHWAYDASENTKYVRGSYKGMISSNTSVDFIDFPTRHVAVAPDQQELRLWQSLANGGQVDYYLIGRLDNHQDRSGYAPVKRAFAYHKRNERYYHDNHSLADIALVLPERGRVNDKREAQGLFRMLSEGHFFFDVILANRLQANDLSQYKALIVADAQNMSRESAAAVDAFTHKGGTVLATGRSGFFDNNEPLDSPMLACLGVTSCGVSHNARGAYFDMGDKRGFARFEDIDLLYIDGDYTYASYSGDVAAHAPMIPPQPYGPPEMCYPTFFGGAPAYVTRTYGKGKAVFVPWLPGRLFLRQGYPNTALFVWDLLEGEIGAKSASDCSPMVEITYMQDAQKRYRLVHLVNGSGHFSTSFYPPVPMHDISVRVPCDHAPARVASLVSGQELAHVYESGVLRIAVDTLHAFEAIAIE